MLKCFVLPRKDLDHVGSLLQIEEQMIPGWTRSPQGICAGFPTFNFSFDLFCQTDVFAAGFLQIMEQSIHIATLKILVLLGYAYSRESFCQFFALVSNLIL